MRVCDICGAVATCKVTFSDDGQEIDVCGTHKNKILEVMGSRVPIEDEKPRRGRPPKNE